ncbi:hypothetical protein V5799_013100 [Amblyomma americanum]|uniref:Uncharacterized protein n=1 Tax=Amblyomma americanum TaxID=6943 RepID=A0AAQ4E6X3_AMBAM
MNTPACSFRERTCHVQLETLVVEPVLVELSQRPKSFVARWAVPAITVPTLLLLLIGSQSKMNIRCAKVAMNLGDQDPFKGGTTAE